MGEFVDVGVWVSGKVSSEQILLGGDSGQVSSTGRLHTQVDSATDLRMT